MEDAVIQGFTQAIFEIGEDGLTGDKAITNACIEAIVLSFNGIAHHIKIRFSCWDTYRGSGTVRSRTD